MWIYLFIVAYLGITIYTANQVQIRLWDPQALRLLLYASIGLMLLMSIFPLQAALLSELDPEITPGLAAAGLPSVRLEPALAAMAFMIACAGISVAALHMPTLRQALSRVLPAISRYDPDSAVHQTAIVLMCLLLSGVVLLFILSGGQEGLAQSLQETGISLPDVFLTALLQVTAAVLGTGYAIRRSAAQTLARLGLHPPQPADFLRGAGIGLGFYVLSTVFVALWTMLVSPEQLAEQTRAGEQLTVALSNLPLALVVSLLVATGEEILVRGALQPVFGIWISSAFFTLLHTQYYITPALLLLFILSVGFGFARQRYNTTTTIVAHFVYNFIQLLLALLLTGGL